MRGILGFGQPNNPRNVRGSESLSDEGEQSSNESVDSEHQLRPIVQATKASIQMGPKTSQNLCEERKEVHSLTERRTDEAEDAPPQARSTVPPLGTNDNVEGAPPWKDPEQVLSLKGTLEAEIPPQRTTQSQSITVGTLTIEHHTSPTLDLVPLSRLPASSIVSSAAPTFRHRCVNILVVGAPQVGKSALINSWRFTVTGSTKWARAPVGICGNFGTMCFDVYPNNPVQPRWALLDTPGRLYERCAEENSDDSLLLHLMLSGFPTGTKLAGRTVSMAQLTEIRTAQENQALQAVVVVRADHFVEDKGLWRSFGGVFTRFAAVESIESRLRVLGNLVTNLRESLGGRCPFIVVSFMDKLGGTDCAAAQVALRTILGLRVPSNRLYFTASPLSPKADNPLFVDKTSIAQLHQLHQDIMCDILTAATTRRFSAISADTERR